MNKTFNETSIPDNDDEDLNELKSFILVICILLLVFYICADNNKKIDCINKLVKDICCFCQKGSN